MIELVPAPNGFICPDDPGEPGRNAPRWSVNDIEARLAAELLSGRRVLEIGTGLGVSTRAIAKLAERVYTVDVDPWVKEAIAPFLPENVEFHDNIQEIPRPLDAAFIDGFHSYDQCAKDIRDAIEIVKKDGIFVFHDAKIGGVFSAIRDSGLEFSLIHTMAGMAVAWRKD